MQVADNGVVAAHHRNVGLLGRLLPVVLFTLGVFFIGGLHWVPASQAAQHKIFEKSFDRVLSLAEFQGRVFVGVGHDTSAKIYRLSHSGCKIWEDVTPLWRSDTSGRSMAMAVFNNALFVGTDKGEVFGTLEGLKWYNVTGSILPADNWITDMAVFNGYLYLSHFGMTIYRSMDGWVWEPVVGPAPALHPGGFGDINNHDLHTLEVLGGYLYAGIGRDNINGIQIWRTANGTNWTLFQEVVQQQPPPIILDLLPGHVHAMTAFNNKLYVGEFEGSGVFRTDGSVSSWDYLVDNSVLSHGIMRLQGHGGKLYRANYDRITNSYLGEKLLFETTDGGNTWTGVPGSPVVSTDGVNGIGALLSAGGKLYSGTISTKSFAIDPTSKVQVYEMMEESLTCSIQDVNKTISGLKERFGDIAALTALCNPPPVSWPPPPSGCFFFLGGYGQAVLPDSPTWVYSAIEEIMTALQGEVRPRDELRIQEKLALLAQINGEFKQAMELIVLSVLFIDSQGAPAVKPLLDEAIMRLEHAQQLCDEASYDPGMLLFIPAILSAAEQE